MAAYRIELITETLLSPNIRPAPWYIAIVRDADDREIARTRSHLLPEDAYSEAVKLKNQRLDRDKQESLMRATSSTDEAGNLSGT
jgi:hypothetical protein